jgi:hypothetical protein
MFIYSPFLVNNSGIAKRNLKQLEKAVSGMRESLSLLDYLLIPSVKMRLLIYFYFRLHVPKSDHLLHFSLATY